MRRMTFTVRKWGQRKNGEWANLYRRKTTFMCVGGGEKVLVMFLVRGPRKIFLKIRKSGFYLKKSENLEMMAPDV